MQYAMIMEAKPTQHAMILEAKPTQYAMITRSSLSSLRKLAHIARRSHRFANSHISLVALIASQTRSYRSSESLSSLRKLAHNARR